MLDAWRNYCNALLVNPKFDHALRLAQTVILTRESESQSSKKYVKFFTLFLLINAVHY